MAQLFKCESCRRFQEKKIFGKEGICFLIPKKQTYVNKTQWCKYWVDRRTGLNVAKTTQKLKKGEIKDVLETSRDSLE